MKWIARSTLISFGLLLLSACATSPFQGVDNEVTAIGPADALNAPFRVGEQVIWGGQIVSVNNLEQFTELELVALPLDGADRPRRDREAGVRFVIRHSGFLEPMSFSPGRYVTALGVFESIEPRTVGDFVADQPVLLSERIELWPVVQRSAFDNVSIGVGVRL